MLLRAVASLILACFATSALAQIAPLQPGTRTISVTGHAEAKAKPDLMIVSFEIETKAATGDECTRLQAQKTDSLISKLKAKAGAASDIETGDYSLNPVDESVPNSSPTPTPTVGNWRFKSSVTATTPHLEILGGLIQAGVAAGASDLAEAGMRQFEITTKAKGPEFSASSGQAAGEYEMLPSVTLAVEASGATPNEAVTEGARKTDKVAKALREKLQGKGSVTLSELEINQERTNPPPRPFQQTYTVHRSYTARANVSVKAHDLALLGPLLEEGMKSGATELNSVSFTLNDDTAARKQAIEQASSDAQSKAQVVASSMGIKLGKILQISINATAQPQTIFGRSFMQTADGGSTASFSSSSMPVLPRQVGLTADINAVYEIQ